LRVAFLTAGGLAPCLSSSIALLIEQYSKQDTKIEFFAYKNGYKGLLKGEIISIPNHIENNVQDIISFGGSFIGNSRVKLTNVEDCINNGYVAKGVDPLEKAANQLKEDKINILHTIGGDDTNTTAGDLVRYLNEHNYNLTVVGLPKTVDNDLPYTDCSPGFGSVAKYIATSTLEAGLDVKSMAETSTKVFILEVMGRHAGWIAAASCLAATKAGDPPHIILLPEVPFEKSKFITQVKQTVKEQGYCVIVASEGTQTKNGKFLADSGLTDAFGHKQLGGVAPVLAGMISKIGLKNHWAVADYLQRSARHIASKTDLDQAYAVGEYAVKLAISGKTALMPIIKRTSDSPYKWKIATAPLKNVANIEKTMPKKFISKNGFEITQAGKTYLSPLIKGEAPIKYVNGLPDIAELKKIKVKKKLN